MNSFKAEMKALHHNPENMKYATNNLKSKRYFNQESKLTLGKGLKGLELAEIVPMEQR